MATSKVTALARRRVGAFARPLPPGAPSDLDQSAAVLRAIRDDPSAAAGARVAAAKALIALAMMPARRPARGERRAVEDSRQATVLDIAIVESQDDAHSPDQYDNPTPTEAIDATYTPATTPTLSKYEISPVWNDPSPNPPSPAPPAPQNASLRSSRTSGEATLPPAKTPVSIETALGAKPQILGLAPNAILEALEPPAAGPPVGLPP